MGAASEAVGNLNHINIGALIVRTPHQYRGINS